MARSVCGHLGWPAGQENWPAFLKASPLVSEVGSRESVGSCRVTAKCRVPQSLMK